MTRVLALHCALALAAFGCAGLAVETQRDPGFDFARATSWQWSRRVENFAAADARLASDQLHDALRAAIADELAARGLSERESGADVSVAYVAGIEQTVELEVEQTDQPAGLYGGAFVGVPRVEKREVERGSLLIELRDADDARWVWRGATAARLHEPSDPDARDRRLRAAVEAILTELPAGR